jgi:hypothetical protein
MSWPVEKILEEALKLDPTDRAFVIAELCRAESSATPEEVEAAWRDEIALNASAPSTSLDSRLERLVRRFPLEGFPFYVVTTVMDRALIVVAVAHARRKPGYWLERIK